VDVHRDVSIVVSSSWGVHCRPRGNGTLWLRLRRFHPIHCLCGGCTESECNSDVLVSDTSNRHKLILYSIDKILKNVREPTNNDMTF